MSRALLRAVLGLILLQGGMCISNGNALLSTSQVVCVAFLPQTAHCKAERRHGSSTTLDSLPPHAFATRMVMWDFLGWMGKGLQGVSQHQYLPYDAPYIPRSMHEYH